MRRDLTTSFFILGFCWLSAGQSMAQRSGRHAKGDKAENGETPKPALIRLIDANLRQACNQYEVLMGHLPPGRLPKTYAVVRDRLETSDPGWWTSGFYAGTLYYLYEFSHDTVLLNEALRSTKLLEKEQYNKGTHDLGFNDVHLVRPCGSPRSIRVLRQHPDE